MPTGTQAVAGALNVTFNDTTSKGAYMPDGSLRVTDLPGKGVCDQSGALRVVEIMPGKGTYQAQGSALRIADDDDIANAGSYAPDGSLQLNDVLAAINATYVAEDGISIYVTEDGANNYVAE